MSLLISYTRLLGPCDKVLITNKKYPVTVTISQHLMRLQNAHETFLLLFSLFGGNKELLLVGGGGLARLIYVHVEWFVLLGQDLCILHCPNKSKSQKVLISAQATSNKLKNILPPFGWVRARFAQDCLWTS